MKTEEIIQEAKDNAKKFTDFFADYREAARDDTNCMNGDPWTDDAKAKRAGRPMEIINDAKITKRRTIEDYDQKRSTIKVKGYDNGLDKLTAEAFQGVIYDIQNRSMGQAVKDKAMSDMLDCGMGYYRLDSEFESNESHNQVIVEKQVIDNFSVFVDIMYNVEIDNSDMMFGGWIDRYDEDSFKDSWPDADIRGFPGMDDQNRHSLNSEIAVCTYYRIEMVNDTLISVASPLTGEIVSFHTSSAKDKQADLLQHWSNENEDFDFDDDLFTWLNDTGRILADRDIERSTVKWYKITDSEILDQGDWGGEYIPIIPVLGPRYIMDGSVYFDSIIREQKGPIRLHNYVMSNYVETMATQPIAPYLTDWRKIAAHMPTWANANNNPTMALPFDPVDNNGVMDTTPPLRQPQADVPAGWNVLANMAQDAKSRTSGLPDSALGMQGNEVSGDALEIRTQNGLANRSVFFKSRHFADELEGKQLATLIPIYYDTERMLSISSIDGKSKLAMVNKEEHENGEDQFKGKHIDLKNAKVSTYIQVGPSFSSLRKETTEKLMQILPLAGERYADVVFPEFIKYTDIVDSDELYEKCMMVAPQEIREDGEEKTPQQLQAENSQLQQQIEQLTQVNGEMEKVLIGEKEKVQGRLQETQMKTNADLKREVVKQQGETKRELISSRTDIKEAEIDGQTAINVQMLKIMDEISKKVDSIATITA